MDYNGIVYLQITSFVGISIGAVHYYGELYTDGIGLIHNKVMRTLTATSAAKLTKLHGKEFAYHAGEKVEGFDSEEQLQIVAKGQYKKFYPNASALVVGNNAVCAPHRVVDGPEWFVKLGNKLYEIDKLIEESYLDNPQTSDSLWDMWKMLVDKLAGSQM